MYLFYLKVLISGHLSNGHKRLSSLDSNRKEERN